MRSRIRAAALAVAITAGLVPAAAGPASASRPASAGTVLWTARYPGGFGTAVVVSPDSSTIYAAGGPVVAYDTVTGARRWVAQAAGSRLALSQDGTTIFAVGTGIGSSGLSDYATAAISTATGATLWTASYHGPGVGNDQASSVAVSPDGSQVFVTGQSSDTTDPSVYDNAYATVAYDAATGARQWVSRYSEDHMNAGAYSVAVSPDGTRVYVTGGSLGPAGQSYEYATVAYDAATGTQEWADRYSAVTGRSAAGRIVAVSPEGSTVFVTGTAHVPRTAGTGFRQVFVTLAYNAATGAQLWSAQYPPMLGGNSAQAMAVSPDGSEVFVTGQGQQGSYGYATVAYDAATGGQLWARRISPGGFGLPESIAVSPDGSEVFVTGYGKGLAPGTTEYATVAYGAADGTKLWLRPFPHAAQGSNQASMVAVSPDGSRVFVTGGAGGNMGTVAYTP